ncbi:Predicted arabinose efflux permease, MFS family [Asanoa hainanensis]|uniref:Predicted arabinose efflux permease, MFS family n=2 Tax=Asanoa hainanensis TaxID=560556 RepID=A0A239NRQ0_9ACTN|nr:Predicted arabinose efflux permease, MFS family [Asanoa hainanensis]
MAGETLVATTLALALQERGSGGLAVSGLWLAATLPLVALAPLAGRLADRGDSRTLLVGIGVAQALVCAALAFVTAPVAVIALVAVLASGLAITNPVFAALVPSMVTRDDLPKASAIGQTASMIGMLTGPAAAGFLVGAFGTRPPLLIGAVTYLAIAGAGLLLKTRRGATPEAAAAAAKTAWTLRGDGLLLATFLAFGAVVAGVGGVNVVEVFFIRDTLGASASAFGLVTASWTAGMAAGAWVFAKAVRRYDDDASLVRALLVLLGSTCVPVVLSAAAPGVWVVVLLWLAGGLLNGGLGVFSTVLVSRRVPERARGRAFAGLNAAANGGAMFGYVLAGALLGPFSPRALVLGFGLAGVLAVVAVAVPVARAIRQERVTSVAVA